MSALYDLFLEIEKDAVLRAHAKLVWQAREEYVSTIKTLEEFAEKVTDLNAENARLRKYIKSLREKSMDVAIDGFALIETQVRLIKENGELREVIKAADNLRETALEAKGCVEYFSEALDSDKEDRILASNYHFAIVAYESAREKVGQ